MSTSSLPREKGRDLTQSCDKNPFTHRTIQKATKYHQNPSSGSGEEDENVKIYERITDDALYDNSSLEPSAQVS